MASAVARRGFTVLCRTLPRLDRRSSWPATSAEVLGKIIREITLPNCTDGSLEVILYPNELYPHCGASDLQQDVSGSAVTILRTTHAAGVNQVNTSDLTLPR